MDMQGTRQRTSQSPSLTANFPTIRPTTINHPSADDGSLIWPSVEDIPAPKARADFSPQSVRELAPGGSLPPIPPGVFSCAGQSQVFFALAIVAKAITMQALTLSCR